MVGTAVRVVLLKISLNPLIIPSVNSTDFTEASSSAVAAVEEFATVGWLFYFHTNNFNQ